MKRSPRALWTTVTTTLAIAALTALGAAQAPDTANASSSDPAAAAARPAGTSQQSWPTVRTGSHGHAVVALQHLLAARGHAVTPDGAFGPRTAAAVKTFQQSRSLEADGVVGPKTWNALITTLSTGSHGHAVVALQHLLAARGHAVTPDGAFGPRTAAAVKTFQQSRSLEADGVVGPKTWSTLLSASKTAKPATPGTKAKPGAGTYVLKFTKNHRYPTYSTLSLLRDGNVLKTYRAGSGEDGVTDECASGKGWLPNGTYKIKGHETNRNDGWFKTGIKGNAIQLEDKYCKPKPGRTPVKRTALYIHSEMLSDGTQNPVYLPGVDNYYRWDGDFDYESWGCIKLAPKDIKDLFKRLSQAYWPKNLTLQVR